MKHEEKKLMKNTLLLMLGNFSSKLLIFLMVPLYTSVLSTSEYATSDLLTTTINLLYPFATLMISTAVMRFCLEKSNDTKQLLSIGIWIEAIGILLVAIGSLFFFNTGDLQGYRGYFIAGFAGYSYYTLLMEYAKGNEKVGLYSLAGVCNTIALISCNIIFLLRLGLGIKGYLLAMVSAYWVTIIVLFLGCKAWKDIVFPNRIQKQYVKEMLTYSIPLMPNSISWWISNSSDRYIMNIFRGLNELGIYSVSYKLPSIMTTISGILISAWEMSAVDDFGSEKSRKFFSQIYELWVNVYIIVCTILTIFVKTMAYILFQKDFFIAWKFVPILFFASVFSGLSSFLGTVFTAAKETKAVFVTTMAGAAMNIVLNFVMIPIWGGYGAAIATAIGYLTTFFARLIGSNKIMKLDVNHKEHILKLSFVMIAVILSCMDSWLNYIVGVVILFTERKFIVGMINKGMSRIKRKKVFMGRHRLRE